MVRQQNDSLEPALAVRCERRNGIDRLSITGELDIFTAQILQREIDDVAHAGGALILDLRDLRFVDRFGVRVLERAAERACCESWRLCIVNPRDDVRYVIEMARADPLLSADNVSDFVDEGDADWSPISLPTLLGHRNGGPLPEGLP
jgi:anti-anti-sigma factor